MPEAYNPTQRATIIAGLSAAGMAQGLGNYAGEPTTKVRSLKKAIDAVLTGSFAAGPIVGVGDSTMGGHSTNGTLDDRTKCWLAYLVTQLNARGVPASFDSLFGASNKSTTSAALAYDSRLALGANWAIQNQQTAGGYFYKFPLNTAPTNFGFTPTNAFNQADIYYLRISGGGSFAVLRDGVAASSGSPVATAGSTQILKATVNFGSTATGQLQIAATDSAQGNIFIFGVVTRNTAVPRLEFISLAWGGSNSTDWLSTALGNYSPSGVVTALSPVAMYYNHGINDWNAGTTSSGSTAPTALATYSSNITTWLDQFPNATPILVRSAQSNPAVYSSAAVQDTYFEAMRAIAVDRQIPFSDNQFELGDYTAATADALMGDDRHPTAKGYQRMGRQALRLMLSY